MTPEHVPRSEPSRERLATVLGHVYEIRVVSGTPRAGFDSLRELLDQLRDDERTDRQQHHHRRADDREADEVTCEVRHAVEWDRGVARLHDHPAARSPDDRVSRSEGKLDGPNRGLVASDAGL